jgi:hypothetical protein
MDPGTGSRQKRSRPDLNLTHRLQSEKARATAQIRRSDRRSSPADRQAQPGAVSIVGTAAPRKLFKKHRDIVARDTTSVVDAVDAKDAFRGVRPRAIFGFGAVLYFTALDRILINSCRTRSEFALILK